MSRSWLQTLKNWLTKRPDRRPSRNWRFNAEPLEDRALLSGVTAAWSDGVLCASGSDAREAVVRPRGSSQVSADGLPGSGQLPTPCEIDALHTSGLDDHTEGGGAGGLGSPESNSYDAAVCHPLFWFEFNGTGGWARYAIYCFKCDGPLDDDRTWSESSRPAVPGGRDDVIRREGDAGHGDAGHNANRGRDDAAGGSGGEAHVPGDGGQPILYGVGGHDDLYGWEAGSADRPNWNETPRGGAEGEFPHGFVGGDHPSGDNGPDRITGGKGGGYPHGGEAVDDRFGVEKGWLCVEPADDTCAGDHGRWRIPVPARLSPDAG
jgi:hypothetical protein